ncbi:translation initiation factor IF-2 [Lujinxingia litoralis]|uniref:Translation initiation factor IF-2 n=1 Tax=Lujinxingia litoralis TaxID=2211119 RepID=A0A328CA49_9DELT|nr:translation initiation factor IF-2 [Lujinxingia litoralis]RAL25345.1 translation initiation factor IF-2 [Lujinxingia litoralis]
MPKQRRVYELADELGINKQELVSKINELDLGFSVNNYMTVLNPREIDSLKAALGGEGQAAAPKKKSTKSTKKKGAKKAEEPKKEEEAAEAAPSPVVRRRRKVQPVAEEEEAGEESAETEVEVVRPTVRRRRKVEPAAEAEEAAEAEVAAEAPTEEPVVEEPEAEAVEAEVAAEEPAAEEVVAEEAPVEAPVAEEPAAEEVVAEEAPVEAPVAEEPAVEEAVDAPVEEPQAEEPVAEAPKPQEKAEEPAKPTPEAAPKKEAPATAERPSPIAPPVRRPPPARAPKGGAKVLGRISESVLKDRLAAENKDFTPGPSRGPGGESRSSSSRRRGRTKRVVEGSDLYDPKSRRSRRRNSRGRSRGKAKRTQKTEITQAAEHKRVIRIEDVISVGDLAHQMGAKAAQVAMKLIESGMMATVNTTLDFETAALVADEFDYTVENVAFDIANFYDTTPDDESLLEKRAPVVTVMGHVDHGKTSLLDAVRASTVTSGEAGGITQHIGAYMVETAAGMITFLDTPGHEAFTALRARGAKATDIVVLVVAADDGVMPQTVEAINHARAAEVPIIVAVNKIDKPAANPDRVKTALTEYNLIPEEWGGSTLFVEVSALERINIDGLLEAISLQAELQELRSNANRDAQGIVIEAELDIGRGPVATILVQRGTLNRGDILVSGRYYGRVRTMHNDRAQVIEKAGPSQPVEITGLSGIPEAGEPFFVVTEERDAKRITENVADQRRKEVMASRAKESAGSLEDLSAMIARGEMKTLKIILKGDVQGSVEAIKEAFGKLGNEEVRTKIIHTGVGGITENDVNLAASSDAGAVIVGFNVRPDNRAAEVADKYGVQILTHSIIYDAIEQVRNILEGLLSPIVQEKVLGHAEVRETFSAPKVGTVAGVYVTDGILRRNAKARLLRGERVIYESTVASLRRFKDDAKEVKTGFECGMSLENYNDIKIGDVIEVFELEEVAATFD